MQSRFSKNLALEWSRQSGNFLWPIFFVAPAVLGFLLWQLIPIVASLIISFTDSTIIGETNWIGFQNYRQMFVSDQLFRQSLTATFYYAIFSVPLRTIAAFFLAVLLNQRIHARPVFRTIFYLPSIVPAIASSVLWIWLFNPDFGLLNALLEPLGFGKLQWIYSTQTVIPSLVLMSLWDVGPMMIIFLAGLQSVPRFLYEAAEIDGANKWHKLIHITVPIVSPAILFNLILGLINALQTFTQPYVMTQGGPNNSSLLYVLYLYRKAFDQFQMGYASALAWVIFLAIAGLSYLVFRSSPHWVHYDGK